MCRKKLNSYSIVSILLFFPIFLVVSCSQPFTFLDVMDELEGGSGSSTFPDIDYIVESITNNYPTADVGDLISQSFIFRNQGIDSGTSDVYWIAYISDNPILDGDIPVSSGSAGALSGSAFSGSFDISGIWPSSGIYYLLVNVSGGGDIDPSNNYLASNQFTIYAPVGEIDYTVSNVTKENSTVSSGSLCSENFDITNGGGTPGVDNITWTAYASTHSSLGEGTDIFMGTDNTLSGLAAHSTYSSVSISGNWPGTAGDYYLIIDLEADNETITDNNTAYIGMFTVKDPPDYSILTPNFLAEGVPGAILSATAGDYDFIITENAGYNGGHPISWEVFASTDAILDGNDESIKAGNISPLTAGSSSGSISFADAQWLVMGSYYYIIINIDAGDDNNSSNNSYVSNVISVPELYTENGLNSSTTPPFTNVSDMGSSLFENKISENELIIIDGVMDATGEFDTYKFVLDSSVSSLEIYAEWDTTGNKINFSLLDDSGSDNGGAWVSGDIGEYTSEPVYSPKICSGIIPGTYYLVVEFMEFGPTGSSYSIQIQGKP